MEQKAEAVAAVKHVEEEKLMSHEREEQEEEVFQLDLLFPVIDEPLPLFVFSLRRQEVWTAPMAPYLQPFPEDVQAVNPKTLLGVKNTELFGFWSRFRNRMLLERASVRSYCKHLLVAIDSSKLFRRRLLK